ncbi:cytidine and deoxycytidylate deaminase zinc-binding domain-containing protein [Hirsutella rhossiliensis]|uniref:Cytidine and deoxycytidylate deaminase zinc-binding domain-containing protein n=1 Tax=Hirsutella rhossiliensis TaxID=111463 RepID=A0A9P8MT80_9HYPO|nr:cytidine and deoxycytidylate deaminase zinc-binding domain-containing protein [Hirsutella rhossiliensis]KAH0958767.1 cytidine and deoxycytidylate deaminase zinc-binding domain-containing protein [Hirsutella rhossiliensis]
MGARTADDHRAAMLQALDLAKNSPPKPSNFCVGAILVRLDDHGIAASGYTLECPGNTHAEECCLLKLAAQHSTTEEGLAGVMKSPHALYTTMEPCFKRLSGKMSCVDRIRRQSAWIKEVYIGVCEPETFVGQNPGRQMLEEDGIHVHHVLSLEEAILAVATAGHISS